MTGQASNAVFISYRREAGGFLAMALYRHLTTHGLDVFYDIESLPAGEFEQIILNEIAARPYFLLVLTPESLDRCREPNDWVHREIEQALSTKRTIVPVHTPSFDFDDITGSLPETLAHDLRRLKGLEVSQERLTRAVQQLIDEFLLPVEPASLTPSVAGKA